MKTVLKVIGALALALFGAVGGAMLTTNYTTMRANGTSYLPAVQSGLGSIADSALSFVTSPWFLLPLGAIALVLTTIIVTVRAMRPKRDTLKTLGYQMHEYVKAAHHDRRFRGLSSVYHDTMRICREMEAFMVQVELNGLPVPKPQSEYADQWIDLACDYFEAVGPYLRGGNVAHAIAVATNFAERNPPRR